MKHIFKRAVSTIMSVVMAFTLKAGTPSSIEKKEPERGKAAQIITSSIQNLKDNSGLSRDLEIRGIPGYHSLLDTIRPKASSEDIEALLTRLQVYSTNNLTTDIIHNGLDLINNLSDCDYEYDGNVDSIIENIRENTKSFVKENPQYCPALITEYSKGEIKKNKQESKNGDCAIYAINYQKELPYVYESQEIIDRIFKSCLEDFFNNNPSIINNSVAQHLSTLNFSIFYSMTDEYLGVMGYLDSTSLVILPDNIKLIIDENNVSLEEAITTLLNNALNNIKARLLASKSAANRQLKNDSARFKIEDIYKPGINIPNEGKKNLSCLEVENFDRILSEVEENEIRQLLLLNGPNNMVSFDELRSAFVNIDISSVYKLLGVRSIDDVYSVNQTISAIASRCGEDNIFNDFVILKTKVIPNEDKVHKFASYSDNMLDYIKTNPSLTLEDVAVTFLTIKCHLIKELYALIPKEGFKSAYDLEVAKKIIQIEHITAMAIAEHFGITIEEFRKAENCAETLRTFMAICDMFSVFDYGNDIEDRHYDAACLVCKKNPILETILSAASKEDFSTPLTPCDWDFYINAVKEATAKNIEDNTNDNVNDKDNSTELDDSKKPNYKFEFSQLSTREEESNPILTIITPSQTPEERAVHIETITTRMKTRSFKLEKKKSPYLAILKDKISRMSLVRGKQILPWKKAA